jgi:hypothetical protein
MQREQRQGAVLMTKAERRSKESSSRRHMNGALSSLFPFSSSPLPHSAQFTMSFPPGSNGDPYRQGGIPLPGSYPTGYDAYASQQSPLQPGQRYVSQSGYPLPPQRGANVDVYGRIVVPPPPPPPQIAPSMYPTSAPAGYSVYPRQPPPPQQVVYAAAPPPPPPPPGPAYYQQPPMAAQYPAIPQNPYSGMPAYAYPQTAPLQSGYPSSGNVNPYDPYGAAFNAAMARSYQEGFDSRDRGRQRGE